MYVLNEWMNVWNLLASHYLNSPFLPFCYYSYPCTRCCWLLPSFGCPDTAVFSFSLLLILTFFFICYCFFLFNIPFDYFPSFLASFIVQLYIFTTIIYISRSVWSMMSAFITISLLVSPTLYTCTSAPALGLCSASSRGYCHELSSSVVLLFSCSLPWLMSHWRTSQRDGHHPGLTLPSLFTSNCSLSPLHFYHLSISPTLSLPIVLAPGVGVLLHGPWN